MRGGCVMVRVGQMVTRAVPVLSAADTVKVERRPMRGRVIFVKKNGSFHTVEVEYGKEKLRFTFDGAG